MFAPRLAWLGHAVLLFLFIPISVFGQSAASVNGCVQDPSRAIIRGASISLTRSDSTRFQSQTDERGCFTLTNVKPGTYRLRQAARAGWQHATGPRTPAPPS